jgi:YD repeat-containing protein
LHANPNAFLTVTVDENNNITQVLKDVFGNTIQRATLKDASNLVVSSSTYDILGNLLVESPPTDHVPNHLLPTNYSYNTLGQLETKTIADYIGPNNDQVTETYTYDNAGRLTDSRRTAFGFVYKEVTTDYDDLGRIKDQSKVAEQFAGTPSAAGPALSYYYDGIPSNPSYVATFQGLMNQTSLTSDEANAVISDLTSDGNARGKLTAAVAVNVVERPIPGGSQIENDYVIDFYTYDDEGRLRAHYKVIPSLPLQKFAYFYDLMGRTAAVTLGSNDHAKTWYYTYDDDGRLSGIIDDDPAVGTVVTYEYNDLGLLWRKHFLKENSGNVAASYIVQNTYNVRNWLIAIDGGDGNRLPLLANSYAEDIAYTSAPTSLSGVTVVPQYNGNISAAAHFYGTAKPVLLQYQYDPLNRLTGTTPSDGTDGSGSLINSQGASQISQYTESFGYNDDGRFQTKSVPKSGPDKTYSYYPNSSRLRTTVQNGPSIYFYDYDGNLVYDASKKMVVTYDWRNLPVKFSFYATPLSLSDLSTASGNTSATNGTITHEQLLQVCANLTSVSEVVMLYDADGNRVSKIQVSS